MECWEECWERKRESERERKKEKKVVNASRGAWTNSAGSVAVSQEFLFTLNKPSIAHLSLLQVKPDDAGGVPETGLTWSLSGPTSSLCYPGEQTSLPFGLYLRGYIGFKILLINSYIVKLCWQRILNHLCQSKKKNKHLRDEQLRNLIVRH